MISSKSILVFGLFAAIGMLAWGLSGVFTGKILTKSYGTLDGKRVYYRFVRRDEEPIWFWVLCSVHTAIGIVLMTISCILLQTPALSR